MLAMSIGSRLADRFIDLPPAVTRDIRVTRDIPVKTRDGMILRTDHYAPRLDSAPTVLIRTPYGRRGVLGLLTGRVVAERGFHVVLQSCRGTFGSTGAFAPMRHERADGLDTIAWLERQSWFDGNLFTYGPSYVGFTQWAIAAEAGPALKGMLTAVTASSFREPTYAGGSFSLDTVLNWATLLGNQGGSLVSFAIKQSRTQAGLRRAWLHLPLAEADRVASGREIDFYQEWLACAEDEPYWRDRGHAVEIEKTSAAVCMVGGWYDLFLPWQLADYDRLRAAGHRPRLVIGPWTHADRGLFARSLREGIEWFRDRLTDQPLKPKPVSLYVGGADEWRDFPEWPPAGRTDEWFLRSGGGLTPDQAPTGSAETVAPDRFRYDPADPTASPGGPLLTTDGGRRDNAATEARADVLVYTTDPLDHDVEAIGPVSATIRVRGSSEYFDVFVRICDVDPTGLSENICDGLTRVDARAGGFSVACEPDADGIRSVDVRLWPTAYRWRAGHRIRVQIAGGAHPRYARNTGTGEPLATASTLVAVDHEVFTDAAHPSTIRLWSASPVGVVTQPRPGVSAPVMPARRGSQSSSSVQ